MALDKLYLKLQKFHWTNIFNIKMIICDNFAQKIWLWAITVSQGVCRTWLIFFIWVFFIEGIMEKIF